MTDIHATSEAEVIDAVNGARDWKSPLNIVGNRTKRNLGRPVANWGTVLDVSGLKGIVDYRPEELIITAKPGTPVAEIVAALAEKNQRLGFDPPDLGPLFGAAPNAGTIGGAISCDLNGSSAVRYGRVRDHLLGIRAVNGFGEAFKAGGKVVKNVTGFDIPKLVCSAFGTLCVLTEATFRVFPKSKRAATFAIAGASAEESLALLRRVWTSPLEPTGLAYLPSNAAKSVGLSSDGVLIRLSDGVLIRLEGAAMPLEEKRAALRVFLDRTEIAELEDGDTVFAAVGSATPFAGSSLDVWCIAIPPAHAASLARELNASLWYADWAGGLIWAAVENSDSIHAVAARHEGHATLVRANEDTRNRIAPFPPLSSERLTLTRAVKAAFDPLGLFNPGRMYDGI
jgi:glycolate oxidase FAD binding subunit